MPPFWRFAAKTPGSTTEHQYTKLARHKKDVDKDDYDHDAGLTASGAFYLMA
jgi:hypothetical protein